MNKLINFTDEEIRAEFGRRIKINQSISLLEDLSWKIQDGEIKVGTETLSCSDQKNNYVYSLDLKTGRLERKKTNA